MLTHRFNPGVGDLMNVSFEANGLYHLSLNFVLGDLQNGHFSGITNSHGDRVDRLDYLLGVLVLMFNLCIERFG
jgi:hypothetical protein